LRATPFWPAAVQVATLWKTLRSTALQCSAQLHANTGVLGRSAGCALTRLRPKAGPGRHPAPRWRSAQLAPQQQRLFAPQIGNLETRPTTAARDCPPPMPTPCPPGPGPGAGALERRAGGPLPSPPQGEPLPEPCADGRGRLTRVGDQLLLARAARIGALPVLSFDQRCSSCEGVELLVAVVSS
jgi:hypothetical protein